MRMQRCRSLLLLLAVCWTPSIAHADDWPQWLGTQRDSVWRETGIIAKFPEGLKPKWRAPVAYGYSGPAVADGRVFVMDFVTDADTKGNPAARPKINGTERVLCLNAADGKELWKYEYPVTYQISYPAGPRATPTVAGGKVYTLGAMGNLTCLDAATGKRAWTKDLMTEYKTKPPVWGCCWHPLVEGQKLFCLAGGEGSVAIALDKDSGKELWRSLSAKEQGYCPPTMISAGGKKQLLIWHAESLNSIDPETGKPYWSVPLTPNAGMSIAEPRKYGDYLFASAAFNAAVLLKLHADKPAVDEVWRGKANTAVYSVNSTPFIDEGTLYGVDLRGELRGVKLESGERLWDTFAAATKDGKQASSATAFLVKNGDRYFIMSETGDLIIAKLTPKGYEEISRTHLLEPTGSAWGRDVVWSHPAFANKCVYARNDKELVCVSLAAD
jgi:outer membrane protein assembly factor BamB